MSRSEFSPTTRKAAWTRAGGQCEYVTHGKVFGPAGYRCDTPLRAGVEYHHVLEAALGGDNSLGNCLAVCIAHHKLLTKTQTVPRLTKMRGQQAMVRKTKPAPRKIPYRKATRLVRDRLGLPARVKDPFGRSMP